MGQVRRPPGVSRDIVGSREVEPPKRKRRRSPSDERRKEARTAERIQATARERQAAWLESGRPNETYRLTCELDGLYDEHRDEQAGTLTDPFYGKTMRAGQ